MSQTPKTDAARGWPVGLHGVIFSGDLSKAGDGPFVHTTVARDLERAAHELEEENRRLHVELDAYHNGEQLRVLRAENAVLKADQERLLWLIVHASLDALVDLPGNPMKARAYIDERLHERL